MNEKERMLRIVGELREAMQLTEVQRLDKYGTEGVKLLLDKLENLIGTECSTWR